MVVASLTLMHSRRHAVDLDVSYDAIIVVFVWKNVTSDILSLPYDFTIYHNRRRSGVMVDAVATLETLISR